MIVSIGISLGIMKLLISTTLWWHYDISQRDYFPGYKSGYRESKLVGNMRDWFARACTELWLDAYLNIAVPDVDLPQVVGVLVARPICDPVAQELAQNGVGRRRLPRDIERAGGRVVGDGGYWFTDWHCNAHRREEIKLNECIWVSGWKRLVRFARYWLQLPWNGGYIIYGQCSAHPLAVWQCSRTLWTGDCSRARWRLSAGNCTRWTGWDRRPGAWSHCSWWIWALFRPRAHFHPFCECNKLENYILQRERCHD